MNDSNIISGLRNSIKLILVLFLVWMETDLFADLVLALDKSLKNKGNYKEIWVFSIWIRKKNKGNKSELFGYLISFLGFEPVTQCFNHLEDRFNSLNFRKIPINFY